MWIEIVWKISNFKRYNGELNGLGSGYSGNREIEDWVFFGEIGSFR